MPKAWKLIKYDQCCQTKWMNPMAWVEDVASRGSIVSRDAWLHPDRDIQKDKVDAEDPHGHVYADYWFTMVRC